MCLSNHSDAFGCTPPADRIDHIQQTVAKECGIALADMLSDNRLRTLTEARFISIAICVDEMLGSYKVIGSRHNRDHSTVVHALRMHNNLSMYEAYRNKYERVAGALS